MTVVGFTIEQIQLDMVLRMNIAKNNKGTLSNGNLRCPCNTCKNYFIYNPKEVEYHLLATGFLESYMVWCYHGETSGSSRSGNERMNIDFDDVFDQNEI